MSLRGVKPAEVLYPKRLKLNDLRSYRHLGIFKADYECIERGNMFMTLTRWQRPDWDSVQQLSSSLRDEIDRLFESPLSWFENGSQPFSSGWLPAVDVYEDKDNVFVRAELP